MGLLTNVTRINISDINNIANSSNLPEFWIKINQVVYNGSFWFVILFTGWIILFFAMNNQRDQILNNIMYSGAVITVLSFILRGINMSIHGVVQGLLTDHQMWVFPIVTLIVALIIWAGRER